MIIWGLGNCIYGLVLLGGAIAYLVITLSKTSDDFTTIWESLSTYSRLYFDNSVDSLVSTYKTNMITITIFAIVEGVLYFI